MKPAENALLPEALFPYAKNLMTFQLFCSGLFACVMHLLVAHGIYVEASPSFCIAAPSVEWSGLTLAMSALRDSF